MGFRMKRNGIHTPIWLLSGCLALHNLSDLVLSLFIMWKDRTYFLCLLCTQQCWFSFPFCCCCCLVAKSCLTLQPMDCSPPDSSVHGILQARILEWVAMDGSGKCLVSSLFTPLSLPGFPRDVVPKACD